MLIGISNPDDSANIIATDPVEHDWITSSSDRPHGDNLIDSLEESWDDLLKKYNTEQKGNTDIKPGLIADCCSGKNTDSNECGNYSAGATQCEALFGTCSADDIQERDQPNIKQQYCHDSCKLNPSKCDAVKNNFCASHPEDAWCGCINLENTDDYKNWATLYEEAYPDKTADKFLYLDQVGHNACIHGTDLKDVFLRTEDIAKENSSAGITTAELEKKISDDNIAQLKKKYRKPVLYFLLFLIVLLTYSIVMEDSNEPNKEVVVETVA